MMYIVPLAPPRPAKRPQYGQEATAESGSFEEEEEYYEDFDIEEAIAQLEEYEGMSPDMLA
jgi:hypothetical protein